MKMIWLTQGQFTLVDDKDYEKLSKHKWYAIKKNNAFYAVRNIVKDNNKRTMLLLHREILNITDRDIITDHIDHNGLNNKQSNLRKATWSENNANRRPTENSSSKYLGVGFVKKSKKWICQIQKDKKLIYIGTFDNENDAAMAYNKKAIELHGEFANTNIIK